ncbi:MAG: FeoC-like transcriptional regulator [Oscillochloridaceae bacterium]|nr:FeoC-like transcriptional regulator [Chloroflexaceae bacterium]MDW8392357.1 FeoC-like transcriptional regulator [Oscillochloridaceae bacterium]
MLHEVLQALETAGGPVRLNELSQRLGVDPGVLEDMLAFWVRKGRLQLADGEVCGGGCGACGLRAEVCVFNTGGPRTITLIERGRK